jgi:hypothetical protein
MKLKVEDDDNVYKGCSCSRCLATPPVQAIPSQDEIMDEIDKEAEKINDIMNDKIENHPGMGDLDGYCYNSAETLGKCTDEIAKEMQPYYVDAGKRIWGSID